MQFSVNPETVIETRIR